MMRTLTLCDEASQVRHRRGTASGTRGASLPAGAGELSCRSPLLTLTPYFSIKSLDWYSCRFKNRTWPMLPARIAPLFARVATCKIVRESGRAIADQVSDENACIMQDMPSKTAGRSPRTCSAARDAAAGKVAHSWRPATLEYSLRPPTRAAVRDAMGSILEVYELLQLCTDLHAAQMCRRLLRRMVASHVGALKYLSCDRNHSQHMSSEHQRSAVSGPHRQAEFWAVMVAALTGSYGRCAACEAAKTLPFGPLQWVVELRVPLRRGRSPSRSCASTTPQRTLGC
jgi:hypothetical protein